MSRFAYFFNETFISLRRNLMMTIAGIMTVAISLFLFGGILLVSRLVDHGTGKWKEGVELEIFMAVEATDGEIGDVRQNLKDSADVRKFVFLTKDDAYEEFKRLFQENPDLVETVEAESLPTSFRVTPVTAEQTAAIKDRFEVQPGVDTVITAQEQVDAMLTATKYMRWGFIGMASVLLASSLFLIVNTIRLATYARRREIEVMKLVGASNMFVRVPFMAEGMVQGAVGAGFAVGLVFALEWVLSDLVEGRHNLFESWYITPGDAWGIGLLVLAIGIGIGLLGSVIGLRRFLDV